MDPRFFDVVASVAAIVGGGILLLFESADSYGYSFTGHNVFETVSHGIGLYLIARGIISARSSHLATEQLAQAKRTNAALSHLIETTRQTSTGYQAPARDQSPTPPADAVRRCQNPRCEAPGLPTTLERCDVCGASTTPGN